MAGLKSGASVGRIGKLKDAKTSKTIYPVTISDAVIVEKETLTQHVKKVGTKFSNIDASISNLNTKVGNVENSITALDSKIDNSIATVNGKINTINTEINTVKTDVETNKDKIENLLKWQK